jgi:predicted DNA-binding protein
MGMSDVSATQVKVTLPDGLYMYLKSKAEKFGLSLASYIRYLVINDVKDMDVPVFKMSQKTEERGLRALQEYGQGKTTLVKDIDKYLDSL